MSDETIKNEDGEEIPVSSPEDFASALALKATPQEAIPVALFILQESFQAIVDAAGPQFGGMAVADAIVRPLMIMNPLLTHIIAKMACAAVAAMAPDEAPDEMKSPSGYARMMAETFDGAEAESDGIWEKIREHAQQMKANMEDQDTVDELEELFNLPSADEAEEA